MMPIKGPDRSAAQGVRNRNVLRGSLAFAQLGILESAADLDHIGAYTVADELRKLTAGLRRVQNALALLPEGHCQGLRNARPGTFVQEGEQ